MNPRQIIDWRVPAKSAWKGDEHDMQVEIVSRCLGFASAHPDITLMHAIPNGGWRGKHVGALLKAEGVLSGIPDLCLPLAKSGFHGLYMELKTGKGHVGHEQWEILERLHTNGYFVRVVNSVGVAVEIIWNYLEEMP